MNVIVSNVEYTDCIQLFEKHRYLAISLLYLGANHASVYLFKTRFNW